jgi:bacterioferritin
LSKQQGAPIVFQCFNLELRLETFTIPLNGGYMKGDPTVIGTLNTLLADELTAINQYMVQAELCDNWGYERLHKEIKKLSIDEMKHSEKLIERIIFLEGSPTVSRLNAINIGGDVQAIHNNNHGSEIAAVKAYNDAIQICVQAGDNGTRELLKSILTDEEDHIEWLEAQLDQIKQMGIQLYLAEQTH